MAYPELLAGEILTAAKITARQTSTVWKTVDQSVTSSTTLVNDNILSFAVSANATYSVELVLAVTAATAGDIKIDWAVPTSSTGQRACIGAEVASTNGGDTLARLTRSTDWTTDVTYGGGGVNDYRVTELGLLSTAGTSGTLQLRWAQGTSSGTATIVRAGSYLRIRRTA